MPRRDDRNDRLLCDATTRALREDFPGINFERLLCRPRDAMKFCRAVRAHLGGVDRRSDEDILWTILNLRKMGRFSLKENSVKQMEVEHAR